MNYDVVVIGAGASGLTTALYTAREGLKTLIIEKGIYGGQMQETAEIENYSGFETLTGEELSEKMYNQAINQGVEYMYGNAQKVEKVDNLFNVYLDEEVITAKSVVVATGVEHRHLNVKGETELAGRGVSYCALCDGAFFKDKDIVVVGGGDSALEEANYLTKFAERVTILHRGSKFSGQSILQERVKNNDKIQVIMNAQVKEIIGDKDVENLSVDIKDEDGYVENGDLPCDGIFIYIGLNPTTEAFKDNGILDEHGYVVTDENMKTSVEGLFAVGDVRRKEVRQVATAVGDGAIAGVSVSKYLESI